MFSLRTAVWTLAGLCLAAGGPATAQVKPSAGMLRYPDVSQEKIVFSYADDLWVVDKDGGVASPLASPPGGERFPRFSPDGQDVAFVGKAPPELAAFLVDEPNGLAGFGHPRDATEHPRVPLPERDSRRLGNLNGGKGCGQGASRKNAVG